MNVLILFFATNRPRPKSLVPHPSETAVKLLIVLFLIASMAFSGIPQSPNPPNKTVSPDLRSRIAEVASGYILLANL